MRNADWKVRCIPRGNPNLDKDGYGDEEDILGSFFEYPGADTVEESAPSRRVAESQTEEARITALRRELSFALHPDQSDSATDPAKLELWHQVQEAVEHRDLDRLVILHAHMQVLSGAVSSLTPVSRIMALRDMYRGSRDALRRRIRALRKSVD